MNSKRSASIFAVLVLAAPGPIAAQEAASIKITGVVKQSLTLTAADIGRMPRATVSHKDHGVDTTYEGVWLHDILRRAGVLSGAELRGKALSSYVIADARDGYQVVFSLAEIDPSFTDSQVLLADKAAGKPLSETQGPFRLVASKDKPGARSVRMLTRLEVVQLRK